MRILNIEEKNLFDTIFRATQESLKEALEIFLKTAYGESKIIVDDKYIIAKGDIPVGLVAHMDTVHRIPVKDIFYDTDKNVVWSPEGIGADDRAGIFGMMDILGRGLRPTLILTTDEEIGGLGALQIADDKDKLDLDLNFLIELDRRGSEDCVFYDCDNESFERYIEDYGFKTQWGSFSDISYICPAFGIAGVNLSIGYYNEHSYSEYLNITEMFVTLDKVQVILEELRKEDRFEYIPYKRANAWNFSRGFGDGYGDYSSIHGSDTFYNGREEVCWECIGVFDSEVMIKKDEGIYCGDCYAKLYSTCVECNEDFKDPQKVHLVCEKCR